MKKLIAALIAVMFAAVALPTFAADDVKPAKSSAKKFKKVKKEDAPAAAKK